MQALGFVFSVPNRRNGTNRLLFLTNYRDSYSCSCFSKRVQMRTRLALILNLGLQDISSGYTDATWYHQPFPGETVFFISHSQSGEDSSNPMYVTHCLSVTIPGAMTNNTSLPNPVTDVRGNKWFPHPNRFIFLYCNLSKRQYFSLPVCVVALLSPSCICNDNE